jgi:superfamily II DNA or RNA helicase
MQAGDEIRLIGDPGRRGTFTGRETARAGRLYIQVRFPDRTDWVPRDQVEVVPESGEAAIDLLRRGRLGRPADLYRTLAHIWLSGRLANFIYSLDTTETDFYAYQFKPVLKLLHSVSNGILIADEVGLGKTIEAGLIWTELRSRFDFRRLVVVCPAMLREKWRDEMRRRFGVEAQICGAPETLETLRLAAQGENPEFCLVASMQGLRPPKGWEDADQGSGPTARLARLVDERAEEESLIDLLVIDEAHYLRNPETQTAELGRLLRRVSQFAILLSATPVHLRSEDLYYLLNLVDEDSFSRRDIFEQILEANQHLLRARDAVTSGRATGQSLRGDLERAAAHPLLAGNRQLQRLLEDLPGVGDLQDPGRRAELAYRVDSINLLGHAVTRTRKRDVKEWRVLRQPLTERVEMSPLERAFYETVTATVREFCASGGRHEGFLLVMPQRQMSSCMVAALRSWSGPRGETTEELYEDLGLEAPEEGEGEIGPLVMELRRRAAELGNLADLERHDSKYERLRTCLQAFLREHAREKVVVFSYFRHSLEYLRDRLRRDGVSCIMLLGGMPDKEEVLREFRETEGLSVLLSSEVGSEGIDLQFCWVLVNYDLPWNPMKVEQRIGRLDRIGQESQTIRVWNLLYAETIDDRIYHRLFWRLGIFERALGQLEPILGPHIRRLTEDLLSRQLTPEQEEERIEQTRLALENIRQEEERLEGEAASLVAYGDYILSQVQAARELSRRIRAEDIERHVIDFFGRFYPGCRFQQDERDRAAYKVELSAEAKNDFARFLRERHATTRTQLTRNLPGPVRCRFHNRAGRATGGAEETISQFHPLLRFIAKETEDRRAMEFPAVAARIRASEIPGQAPPGDYRFAVARWTVRALRITEQLWYGVEPVSGPGPALPDQDAEQMILAVARQARDWPNARAELDVQKEADGIEQGLLVRARRCYEAFVEELRAQNEDRADLQEQILRNHLQQQRAKYMEIRQQHLARNNPGLAKVQERNIEKLEARVQRELLEIARKRKLTESMDEICAGIVRVEV